MSERDDGGARRAAGRDGGVRPAGGARPVGVARSGDGGARPAGDGGEERFRVHLQVRFSRARDFVVEYAENLSRGGLFVAGAHDLAPRAPVTCELELPGAGRFTVLAEVAHVLGAETAARLGRAPGAGLEITSAPPGFAEALAEYLRRLGRRRDAVVLTSHLLCARLLSAAGFLVRPLPPLRGLVEVMAKSGEPTVAVLVPRAKLIEYQSVAAELRELVMPIPELPETHALLDELDGRLM